MLIFQKPYSQLIGNDTFCNHEIALPVLCSRWRFEKHAQTDATRRVNWPYGVRFAVKSFRVSWSWPRRSRAEDTWRGTSVSRCLGRERFLLLYRAHWPKNGPDFRFADFPWRNRTWEKKEKSLAAHNSFGVAGRAWIFVFVPFSKVPLGAILIFKHLDIIGALYFKGTDSKWISRWNFLPRPWTTLIVLWFTLGRWRRNIFQRPSPEYFFLYIDAAIRHFIRVPRGRGNVNFRLFHLLVLPKNLGRLIKREKVAYIRFRATLRRRRCTFPPMFKIPGRISTLDARETITAVFSFQLIIRLNFFSSPRSLTVLFQLRGSY